MMLKTPSKAMLVNKP